MSETKVLLLALNCFSSTGGIQKVCRTLAYTLNAVLETKPYRFQMLALHDTHPDKKYLSLSEFMGFGSNRTTFIKMSAIAGFRSKVIIVSHINLLPVAMLTKIIRPTVKIILIAHGKEVWGSLPAWKRYFIRRFTTIWAVSNFTKDTLQKAHQFDPLKITLLHNCLDPFFNRPINFKKPDELLKRYQLTANQPVLLTICRITKDEAPKGYEKVIRIIPDLLLQFPNLHYLICGKADPEEEIRLRSLILRHNVQKNIILTNFIHEDELTAHYLLADVFVLPSKKEGFGLVFIEAAACGCNIISGNADGSKEAMLNGALGTMIDPENSSAIKEAILQNLNQRRRSRSALATQKKCFMHFSQERYQQEIENILQCHL